MQNQQKVLIQEVQTQEMQRQTPLIKPPALLKLGACLIYEVLVIIALSFASALTFLLVFGDASHGVKRYAMQLFLWLSIGIYFVWCWHKSGQTLAMQTWRFKIVTQNNQLLSLNASIARYIFATIGLVFFGVGFLWAIVDRNHLFLHDRLLKNQVIVAPRNAA